VGKPILEKGATVIAMLDQGLVSGIYKKRGTLKGHPHFVDEEDVVEAMELGSTELVQSALALLQLNCYPEKLEEGIDDQNTSEDNQN
jgi:hypothetical protein